MIYQLSESYYVRPLIENDIEGPYSTWFQDQEVCQYNSHGKLFKNKEYFREYIAQINSPNHVVWAMCYQEDHKHIGNISLQRISWIDRTAELAIILGDKQHWGRGVGRLAARELLRHGFNKLNLERVYCGTAGTNSAMQALALSLGMILEGTQRGHIFLDGDRVDCLFYGILKDECQYL